MRTARPWRVRRQPRERRSCALDRQLDDERAARPGLRFHAQRAVRIEYEASHDRQAEARPAGFGRVEVVEGAIQLLFGHPLAGVRDHHTAAGLSARPRRAGSASRPRLQPVRALAGGLTEMPEYVADGYQAVLDVVIHLAGEVAHREPALSLAQARGPGAQPLGHRSEQATERTDLVGPVAVEGHVQSVH